jgi:hypothetical protein
VFSLPYIKELETISTQPVVKKAKVQAASRNLLSPFDIFAKQRND